MNHEMIIFLEDLKGLLLEIDTHHEEDQNEIIIEVKFYKYKGGY